MMEDLVSYTTPEEGKFNKMKIIVIEGLDKSGKFTQTKMLTQYLRNKGYRVEQSEFHRYDTPTGQLIQKWLHKEWDVDQLTIELIMTADKQAQQKWFEELEEQGVEFLILDRYTKSQYVYSMAAGINHCWTLDLQKYMRKPDFEILIDISAEESMKRKGKHGENDRYESDIKFLNSVRALYYWYCNTSVDGMKSPEEVHQAIVKRVGQIL